MAKIIIDLSGPEGNAFFILGKAKLLSQEHNLNWTEIKEEMTTGDYDNLCLVFKKHFSEWATLKD